ncbi:sensor histidine kinase [Ferviditalea candida]|uniref:histidine kinase n=1 Tax=Ferviditalea candida TaxID=3108399 RepID=A0ABU5ZDU6_9BACL|nr:ATP-binding protein [Paenibacillaceae bacterium T2]
MTPKKRIHLNRLLHPKSLRFQLLSRSLLILAVLLMFIGVFQYLFMRQFLYSNKASALQSQVLSIPPETWMDGNPFPGKFKDDAPRLFIPDSTIAFVSMNGDFGVLLVSPDLQTVPKFSAEYYTNAMKQRHGVNYSIIKDNTGAEQLVFLQPVGKHGRPLGIVQVSTSTRPIKVVLIRQLFIFLILSLIAMVAGLLTYLPVLKRTLVPLSNMVDTVEQINAGNLDERLPVGLGQLEIERLSVSFNNMLERLEASFNAEKEAKEQMRRFVADASHELRTPLTSIHGFLEVLLRGAAHRPDQLETALKSMYGESERINKLVQDLLLLARMDRTPSLEITEGMLDGVIHEMEPQLRLLAGERTVIFQVEPNVKARFDQDKIKQVILNLFHNAVQHTDPKQGVIRISLREAEREIELAVRDNGPGIPEEHIPHLFDRFYRIDTSRARKYGGSGLGLAITKSIVEIHGGSIHLESKAGHGSSFQVLLPKPDM